MTVQLFLNNYVETTTTSSQALLSIETTFSHELSKMILVGKDIEMLMSIHHTIYKRERTFKNNYYHYSKRHT